MKIKSRKDNRPKETKLLNVIHTKVLDADQGIVEELVAVYGNIDHGRDRIMPGASKKTIQEGLRNVLVLDQHNTDSIFSTLAVCLGLKEITRDELPDEVRAKFPDATGGLLATSRYLLDTPEGKGAFIRIRDGAITQRSIGFNALDMDYSNLRAKQVDTGWELTSDPAVPEVAVRNLRTIQLMEYSPVLWGMNEATTTVSAKQKNGAGADEAPPADATTEPAAEADEGTEHQQGAPSDGEGEKNQKEMTPSGPVRRMGDVITGHLHQIFSMLTDDWLIYGKLSQDEHAAMMGSFMDALDMFQASAPANCMDRDLSGGVAMYYGRSGDQMLVMKAETPALAGIKAGRTLSARNEAAIRGAINELVNVLAAAGISLETAAEDQDDDEKARAHEDQDGAALESKGAPPADDSRAGQDEPPTPERLDYVQHRLNQIKLVGGKGNGTASAYRSKAPAGRVAVR